MIEEIVSRRSIRKFTAEMLTRTQLEAVLTAGLLAPSGKNKQPWRFVVLGGAEKQRVLDAMEQGLIREEAGEGLLPESAVWGIADAKNTLAIMREAPVVVLVLNPFGGSPFAPIPQEKRITELVDTQSVGACIENMLLEAEREGLGGLWVCNTFLPIGSFASALPSKTRCLRRWCWGSRQSSRRQGRAAHWRTLWNTAFDKATKQLHQGREQV